MFVYWSIVCIMKKTTNTVVTNNNKHVFFNEIMWISQILFANATFLSLIKISVVFNFLSPHSNTNLPTENVLQKQFLTSTCSAILHALFHSQ